MVEDRVQGAPGFVAVSLHFPTRKEGIGRMGFRQIEPSLDGSLFLRAEVDNGS